MASLEVESLFTNIPLKVTIEICCNLLYKNVEYVQNLSKFEFKKLLELAVTNNKFMFNNSIFTQIDGVAMGSPLGPTLANVFLSYYEQIWLDECPKEFKPDYYRRYVDDTFVLFRSPEHRNSYLKTILTLDIKTLNLHQK